MKNFPDVFPIRYAIVVLGRHDDDSIMFNQLVAHLRNNSLICDDLKIAGIIVKFPDKPDLNGQHELMINKLFVDSKFTSEDLITGLSAKAKGICQGIGKSITENPYYNLILISYKSSPEIPCFWKVGNGKIDSLDEYVYDDPADALESPILTYNELMNKPKGRIYFLT